MFREHSWTREGLPRSLLLLIQVLFVAEASQGNIPNRPDGKEEEGEP